MVASAPGSTGNVRPGVVERLVQLQARDAGLDGRVEILDADAHDLVHLAKIDRDAAADRVDVPFERRAGAERHDRQRGAFAAILTMAATSSVVCGKQTTSGAAGVCGTTRRGCGGRARPRRRWRAGRATAGVRARPRNGICGSWSGHAAQSNPVRVTPSPRSRRTAAGCDARKAASNVDAVAEIAQQVGDRESAGFVEQPPRGERARRVGQPVPALR